MNISIDIHDIEVERYLSQQPAELERRANTALHIGVLALSSAVGVVDAETVRREGEALVAGMRANLEAHAASVSADVGRALQTYLDPRDGAFQRGGERLVEREALVLKDMESMIQSHVGQDNGTLAATLAKRIGSESPLFKMLDPAARDGLLARLEFTIVGALEAQQRTVLREFSLDDKNSALSRLLGEISGHNVRLTSELSLDRDDSALSRLVQRVEAQAQQTARQFSLDSEDSALSRMLSTLVGKIATLDESQRAFHGNVLEMLARFDERKKTERTGTQHGQAFEFALLTLLEGLAEGAGDLFDATGTTTGIVRNCKVGDAVITIGPERAGAGRKVVWEAKEDQSYGDSKAVEEIELGMKNRGAEVGVFVFSARTAGTKTHPFRRVGNAILVVWDQEDDRSNVYVEAAHAVALALLARAAAQKDAIEFDFTKVDTELAEIEKMVGRVAAIREKCETIRRAAGSIEEEARIVSEKLGTSVGRMVTQVASLKKELA